MRVTVILLVIGALGTFPRSLERGTEELEIGGWIDNTQQNSNCRLWRTKLNDYSHWKKMQKISTGGGKD